MTNPNIPSYRDPFMETQEAVLERVSADPTHNYSIAELAEVAIPFGPIDSRDHAFSAAVELEALGLVDIDRSVRPPVVKLAKGALDATQA